MKSPVFNGSGWSQRILAPYFVLGVSLLVTLLGSYYVWSTSATKDLLQFQNNVQLAQTNIQTRIETYTSALRAGAALFGAQEAVSRDKFHGFVRRLDIRDRYPGVQGIGYAAVIKPEDKDALVQRMQAQGLPDFKIRPESDRKQYTPVLFLEPFDRRNQAAIGFDMSTDPVRRAAMEVARDSGEPVASGPVTLIQEVDQEKQTGFLIYVPVYRKGSSPRTASERRTSLIGFVYSPFHTDDLLEGTLGPAEHRSVDLQVYDGSPPSPQNLLHSSNHSTIDSAPHFTHSSVIPIAGRPWTLVFTSRPEFEYGSGRYLIPFSLVGGLCFSLVLFGVTRSQANARRSAEQTAKSLFESQAALRENEARLRRLVDANIIGVTIADFVGNVVEANDAFLEIVGYTRDDLAAGELNWTGITPPEYHDLDRAAMAEMKQSGSHPPHEKEFIRSDGTRVPVLVGTAYLGGPSDLSVGFLLDLSEQKRAESAIREADQRAINEYERLLERLTALAQALGMARGLLPIYRALRDFALASLPCAGVFISLYDQRRQCCEAAYAWGEGEEIDVSILDPLPISGDGPNSKAVKTGEVVISDDYMKSAEAHSIVIVGAETGMHPEASLVAPLAVMGRIVGTIEVQSYERASYKNEHVVAIRMAANLAAAAIENVQLLESESRARALAEESNRMKDEFLATVSHELRTPLTSILGWARMLMMGGFDKDTTARAIETIERNATSQAHIIDDILEVSRVITGKLQLSWEQVQMSEIVISAVNSIRPAAGAKNIVIKIDIAPGEHIISGDPNRLQQIAWNLLSNAVKFTPPGGRIAVTLKRAGSDLELMVKDNGKGISRNFLPFVFDRFRQADSSITRDHGGLGLGLAIVRHLVELHGGNVYAESEGEGTGATFRLSLPISATALTGGPTASALTGEFARANGSATLSGIHVLVVDDERDTVEMVEAVLCRDGARVTTAGSVKEALESIAQSKPDIIVSDIGMPGQDGYELIRQVRAVEQGSTGGIPAIALTAYVRSDEREMAMLAGYQEHLAKPVDPDVLIAAIAGLTNS